MANFPCQLLAPRREMRNALASLAFLGLGFTAAAGKASPPPVSDHFSNPNGTTNYLVEGSREYAEAMGDFIQQCGANVSAVITAVDFDNIYEVHQGPLKPWASYYRGTGQPVMQDFENCVKGVLEHIFDVSEDRQGAVDGIIVGSIVGGIVTIMICLCGFALLAYCAPKMINALYNKNESTRNDRSEESDDSTSQNESSSSHEDDTDAGISSLSLEGEVFPANKEDHSEQELDDFLDHGSDEDVEKQQSLKPGRP